MLDTRSSAARKRDDSSVGHWETGSVPLRRLGFCGRRVWHRGVATPRHSSLRWCAGDICCRWPQLRLQLPTLCTTTPLRPSQWLHKSPLRFCLPPLRFPRQMFPPGVRLPSHPQLPRCCLPHPSRPQGSLRPCSLQLRPTRGCAWPSPGRRDPLRGCSSATSSSPYRCSSSWPSWWRVLASPSSACARQALLS